MVREIAHRGYADRNAENTVSAVRAAAETADCVEVDVRRCADDVVVCHDDTVDRVTEDNGRVADLTAAELDALSVFGSDEGVPRLAAVLDAVPDDVGLVLELKERGVAADALALAAAAGNDVVVSSFDAAALRTAREADPSVPRAYLTADGPRESVRTARELGCTAVHPDASLCLRSRIVSRAHAFGLSVAAWTVRSRLMAWLLARRGVDAVIADAPETSRDWL
ncbi:MAG: glycerophosphodiester phosphodiesterase [Halobacteriaceae archaeon]